MMKDAYHAVSILEGFMTPSGQLFPYRSSPRTVERT